MVVRIAKPNDLEALVEIYNQAIAVGQKTADTNPFTVADRRQWFKEHTPEKYPIWVAEQDNKAIGYLTISPYRRGRMAVRYTAELSYYIHFDHHRQGVASRLLQHAIQRCPELEIKTLFAVIIDSNLPSIHLMEKFGFEKWGYMPGVSDFDGVEYGHYYYGLKIPQ